MDKQEREMRQLAQAREEYFKAIQPAMMNMCWQGKTSKDFIITNLSR